MTTAVTDTTSSAAASSNTPSASATLGQNYQTFLKLLTTQLKNQDPLDPQDSSQFTNQLVLFSQVEQQIDTNTNLKTLISDQNNGVTSQALQYLGMNVATNSDAFTYSGSGNATVGYTLPSAASSVSIGIFNSAGVQVAQGTGETASGAHDFTWDGTNGSGTTLAAGDYTVEVFAKDANGNAITATTQTAGTVTAVSNSGGTTYLTVNGAQVAVDDVVSASYPASSSGSNSNSQTN